MRFPRILSLQVAIEVVSWSALGYAALVAVLVSQNLIRRLDDLMMVGFEVSDLVMVLRSLLPVLTAYAMPVSFLFGVLVTMRRMSADREVLAMRSCGLGLTALLVPTLCLGVLASALSAHLMISVEHRARREMLSIFKRAATKGGILEPGRFRLIGSRMVFVEGRDRQNRLEGIMIIDHSTPGRHLRIFAERGRLFFDEETDMLHFQLERGDLHLQPESASSLEDRRLSFDGFDYAFDISLLLGKAFSPSRPRQMTLSEIEAVLARAEAGEELTGLDERDPTEYALEAERRFALPLAPLLFALLAVPLGLRTARGGRSWGILICIAMALGYYALLALGEFLARAGVASPAGAFWLPNALVGAAATAMLLRASRGAAT
jgi:lipopolysaccharide export system permease protein